MPGETRTSKLRAAAQNAAKAKESVSSVTSKFNDKTHVVAANHQKNISTTGNAVAAASVLKP